MVNHLKIGQIINTHGVKGEIKIYPLTDNVKRFKSLEFVYMLSDGGYEEKHVEGVKFLKNLVLLKLKGVNDINEAAKLKGQYLYVNRENAVKLPKDTYFITDLIGLEVFSMEGNRLGKITSVFSAGSNDVYEVKDEGSKPFLIPAIKDVVKEVNITDGKIIINLLEGLI